MADVAGLAAIRRNVSVPIAADESVTDADSVDVLVAAGAADVIVIKPAWLGLRASLDAARRAHAAGLAVTVTSALDSSLGIAAAAQVAAAIEGPLRACGLATAELLAGDLVRVPLAIAAGALAVPDGPGLGVEIDREAVARFRIGRSYALPDQEAGARGVVSRGAGAAGGSPAALARNVVAPDESAAGTLLAQRAETYGERLALIDGERALTFSALHARAAAVAARLDAAGVGRGDDVGLLLGDRLSFAVWLHGIAHLGAVAVLLGERLSGAELQRQLRARPCRALIVDPHTSALAAALPDELTGSRLAVGDLGKGDGSPSAPLDLAAPHSVVFTSGSSGAPKPVLLTVGNHFWSAIGSALALGVRDDDRWLACLPLHHVGGLAILMRGLLSAVPVAAAVALRSGGRQRCHRPRRGVARLAGADHVAARAGGARRARPSRPVANDTARRRAGAGRPAARLRAPRRAGGDDLRHDRGGVADRHRRPAAARCRAAGDARRRRGGAWRDRRHRGLRTEC